MRSKFAFEAVDLEAIISGLCRPHGRSATIKIRKLQLRVRDQAELASPTQHQNCASIGAGKKESKKALMPGN